MPTNTQSSFTSSHIGGMLLEEAVLSLIQVCGYRPVNLDVTDPTVRATDSGLRLRGRGTHHQIDAVADYVLPQPLTYPVRLLVEAKYYSGAVGIEVVRNYVGVEKDLQEYWVPSGSHSTRPRHHYRSLIVTASKFTTPAQEYAYAHDISLLPLRRSRFFHPVLETIQECCSSGYTVSNGVRNDKHLLRPVSIRSGQLNELRLSIRSALDGRRNWQREFGRRTGKADFCSETDALISTGPFKRFIEGTSRLNFALIATVGANIPIFLVPAQGVQVNDLPSRQQVRIYWDDQGWYLRDDKNQPLFSFDLPEQLFTLYARQGPLSPEGAVDLKFAFMTTIKALVQTENGVRMVEFELDQPWLEEIRRGFRNLSSGH